MFEFRLSFQDFRRAGTFNLNQGAGNRLEDFLTPGQPRSFVVTVGREWR